MSKDSLVDKNFIMYARKISKDFYKDLNIVNIKNINRNKILELKELAPNILEEDAITKSNFVNYIKKMKRIKKLDLYNIEEKYILFMFCVDPTFENIKIYGESNHIYEIKIKMINFFGVFDSNLIKIEKEFIKTFFTDKEKEILNNEIENRVFK